MSRAQTQIEDTDTDALNISFIKDSFRAKKEKGGNK